MRGGQAAKQEPPVQTRKTSRIRPALTWPDWTRLVHVVEDLGFTGLYLSDHFNMPVPPDNPSLELVVALTYLADHSERVRLGPMVGPVSFRDPIMLARQAAALDDLSEGRMVLGVGAGWIICRQWQWQCLGSSRRSASRCCNRYSG